MRTKIEIGDILLYNPAQRNGSPAIKTLYVKSILSEHEFNIRGLEVSAKSIHNSIWDRIIVESYLKTGVIIHHKRKPNEF